MFYNMKLCPRQSMVRAQGDDNPDNPLFVLYTRNGVQENIDVALTGIHTTPVLAGGEERALEDDEDPPNFDETTLRRRRVQKWTIWLLVIAIVVPPLVALALAAAVNTSTHCGKHMSTSP